MLPLLNPGFSITPLWQTMLLIACLLLPLDVAARRVAIPFAEGFAMLATWLRGLRKSGSPVQQTVERVGRLQKAKERASVVEEKVSVQSIQSKAIEEKVSKPKSPVPSQSASERLIEMKRKRESGE